MSFHLKNFLKPTFDTIDINEKKCYADLLNFSSNELQHSSLSTLSERFFSTNVCEITRCYPYHTTVRQEIAKYYQLPVEEILVAPGSDFAINLLLMTLEHRQSIILLNPEYYSYTNYARVNGITITHAELNYSSFIDTFPNYKQQLNSMNPSLVVLSNPSGVTGLKLSTDAVAEIAKCCHQQGHLLLVDEAYGAFEAIDHTFLLRDFNNVIILRSFSKSHGIAGLRFASIFSQAEVIQYLKKTGVENAVSGLSMAYFSFLLQNDTIIKTIHRDILYAKKEFTQFIHQQFPAWTVFATATHFVTIDTHDESMSKAIVKDLLQKNVLIKHLNSVSDLKTCIRITITELRYMQSLMALLKAFNHV